MATPMRARCTVSPAATTDDAHRRRLALFLPDGAAARGPDHWGLAAARWAPGS